MKKILTVHIVITLIMAVLLSIFEYEGTIKILSVVLPIVYVIIGLFVTFGLVGIKRGFAIITGILFVIGGFFVFSDVDFLAEAFFAVWIRFAAIGVVCFILDTWFGGY